MIFSLLFAAKLHKIYTHLHFKIHLFWSTSYRYHTLHIRSSVYNLIKQWISVLAYFKDKTTCWEKVILACKVIKAIALGSFKSTTTPTEAQECFFGSTLLYLHTPQSTMSRYSQHWISTDIKRILHLSYPLTLLSSTSGYFQRVKDKLIFGTIGLSRLKMTSKDTLEKKELPRVTSIRP